VVKSWSNRDELVHQVVTLKSSGTGSRAIARALGVSRNTVKAIVEEHKAARQAPSSALPKAPARAPRAKIVKPFADNIAQLLCRFPDITAQRVFEDLRALGYKGGYTAIKVYMRTARPVAKPEPSLPTPAWEPGEMAESDWTPCKVRFTNGQQITVQVFSYVLCYSRRRSYGLYEHADLYALMDGHVAAFTRFGGAARTCKYDSQKPVVLRWEGHQPIYNPRFLAYAAYYEFLVQACRRAHPNDKPHVERGFWHFETNFLNGRSFRDLDDMRAQLALWEQTVLDHHRHKKLKRSALEIFPEEAPHLLPLPSHPYDTARVVYRVCSIDGFVAWDGNRYAVPYEAIYDLLPVRVTQKELFVYAPDLRLLARHELAPKSAGKDVDPNQVHRAPGRGIDLDTLRGTFEALGEGAVDFFNGLARLGSKWCGYHARQILLLRERFTSEDIAAALRHAHAYGAYEQLAVARIVEARARPRTLDEYVAEETARRIEQHLGRDKTRPRDLDEYDRLPVLPAPSAPVSQETPWHERPDPPTGNESPSPPSQKDPSSGSDDSSTPSG
jgi:transposase